MIKIICISSLLLMSNISVAQVSINTGGVYLQQQQNNNNNSNNNNNNNVQRPIRPDPPQPNITYQGNVNYPHRNNQWDNNYNNNVTNSLFDNNYLYNSIDNNTPQVSPPSVNNNVSNEQENDNGVGSLINLYNNYQSQVANDVQMYNFYKLNHKDDMANGYLTDYHYKIGIMNDLYSEIQNMQNSGNN